MRGEKRKSYSIEHFLSKTNRKVHFHPVLCGRARQGVLTQTVGLEPFVHQGECIIVRSDQFLDLFFGEMRSVTRMLGVADRLFSEDFRGLGESEG